jgi:hypothetical protein
MTCLPAVGSGEAGDDTEWIRAVALSRHRALELLLHWPRRTYRLRIADLDAACASYASALELARERGQYGSKSQQSRSASSSSSRGSIELISPLEHRLAAISGQLLPSLFLVEDLEAVGADESNRFVPLPAFESEAFGGNLCQFFLSPQAHLVELCQMGEGSFEALFIASLAP